MSAVNGNPMESEKICGELYKAEIIFQNYNRRIEVVKQYIQVSFSSESHYPTGIPLYILLFITTSNF